MNTKKTIFSLSLLLAVTFLSSAQGNNDGYFASENAYHSLNFSQTNPVLGTARYSGMAGAMGAFGGDASTMKDNPAGLGIYRSSDISITPNLYIANDNSVGFNVNNFGIILNFRNSGLQKGYITSSLGISYNRLKNFSRYSNLADNNLGYSLTDSMLSHAPIYLSGIASNVELIDETGSLFPGERIGNQIRYTEEGGIGEWDLSYGINISNRFYFGISAGFVNLDYKLKTMYDEQDAGNPMEQWNLDTYYEASGSGFNLKLGVIAHITDFLRAGLAFHTPTFYSIDEYTIEKISYKYNDEAESFFAPKLQTPLRLQGSLGFIIEKRAIIGLEYQFENFSAMRFSSDRMLNQPTKDLINGEMRISHTAKIGAEVKVIEGLSLRAGFAFASAPSIKLSENIYTDEANFQAYPLDQPQNTFYYTGGIGYKKKAFYADLAYVHQVKKERFFEYLPQEAGPYDLTLHNNNIMMTLGYRF